MLYITNKVNVLSWRAGECYHCRTEGVITPFSPIWVTLGSGCSSRNAEQKSFTLVAFKVVFSLFRYLLSDKCRFVTLFLFKWFKPVTGVVQLSRVAWRQQECKGLAPGFSPHAADVVRPRIVFSGVFGDETNRKKRQRLLTSARCFNSWFAWSHCCCFVGYS